MSQGVIYILTNPAFTGLLKIGKTTRTDEERATELSAGTGTPTRFEVAYEDTVLDCSLAERRIFEAPIEYQVGTKSSRKLVESPKELTRSVVAIGDRYIREVSTPIQKHTF